MRFWLIHPSNGPFTQPACSLHMRLARRVQCHRVQREAICRGSRCGDFQTDRWWGSLWRGNARHFSYQDLSLDKAYFIGFSLKDHLKNPPKTKGERNIPDKEK